VIDFLKGILKGPRSKHFELGFRRVDDLLIETKSIRSKNRTVIIVIPPVIDSDCIKEDISKKLSNAGMDVIDIVDAIGSDNLDPIVIVDTLTRLTAVSIHALTSTPSENALHSILHAEKIEVMCDGFVGAFASSLGVPLKQHFANIESHKKTLSALNIYLAKHKREVEKFDFDTFFDALLTSNIIKDNVQMKMLVYRIYIADQESEILIEDEDYVIRQGKVIWAAGTSKILSENNHQDLFVHGAKSITHKAPMEQRSDNCAYIAVHPFSWLSQGVVSSLFFPKSDKASWPIELVDSKKVQNEYLNAFILKNKNSKITIVVSTKDMFDSLASLPDDKFSVMSHERYILRSDSFGPTVMMQMPDNESVWLAFLKSVESTSNLLFLLSKYDTRLSDADSVSWAKECMLFALKSNNDTQISLLKFWYQRWTKLQNLGTVNDENENTLSMLKYETLIAARDIARNRTMSDAIFSLKLNKTTILDDVEQTGTPPFTLFMTNLLSQLLRFNEKQITLPLSDVLSGDSGGLLEEEMLLWKELIHVNHQ
jgi:hypothetical protein